jgi:hypothetical protein
VSGFNRFGIEFTGAAAACCGFDDVSQSEIQVPPSASVPTFAFQVTAVADVGGPDGLSVMSSNVNAGCSAAGNGFIRFENPGTPLTASTGWIGNRFEANCNSPFYAIQGVQQLARFVSNRWENTGAGGLTIHLSNPLTTDPPAIFNGNVWACGAGNCDYKDETGRSVRSEEYYGPSTTSPYFFTNQTAGGGSSAVTLTHQTAAVPTTPLLNSGTIPGEGFYRVTFSLVLTKRGNGGSIRAAVEWNNGVARRSALSEPLPVTDSTGAELDGSFLVFSTSRQPISYSTRFDNVAGGPQYTARFRLEYVSP